MDNSSLGDRLVVEPQTYTFILFIDKTIENRGQEDTKFLQSVEEENFKIFSKIFLSLKQLRLRQAEKFHKARAKKGFFLSLKHPRPRQVLASGDNKNLEA